MKAGERLKAARRTLGLTQREFGEKLGFEWYKVRDLENGKLRIGGRMALLIEEKYYINFRWLLQGQGSMLLTGDDDGGELLPHDIRAAISSPRRRQILALLSDVDEDDLKEITLRLKEKKRLRDLERELQALKGVMA